VHFDFFEGEGALARQAFDCLNHVSSPAFSKVRSEALPLSHCQFRANNKVSFISKRLTRKKRINGNDQIKVTAVCLDFFFGWLVGFVIITYFVG
jgi:hypothetical protein